MTILNISINDDLMAYIESRITAGEYQSVNDYLRDLVAMDRERMEQTDRFLMEGLENGNPVPLDMNRIRERSHFMFENMKKGQNLP